MKRVIPPLLLLSFWLGACSSGLSSSGSASPAPLVQKQPVEVLADAPPSPTSAPEATTSAPTKQTPDGNITEVPPTESTCRYQWAYQDLPDLSLEVQQAVQILQPNAQVHVFAFGEDCVYTDGYKTFTTMETDFNFTFQSNKPLSADELGGWVVNIMQIILNIPKEKIVSPRPGRVSILFAVGDQRQGINFYIDKYQLLPPGLSNTEIYEALKTAQ